MEFNPTTSPTVVTCFTCFRCPQVRLFFSASLYDVFELQLACEAVALELEEEQRTRQQQQQQQDATSCGSCSSEGVPSLTEVPSVGPSSEALAAANSVIEQGLAQSVKAMAEVSPGSDLHALLAARCVGRCDEGVVAPLACCCTAGC